EGNAMKSWKILWFAVASAVGFAAEPTPGARATVIVVAGAPGEAEFAPDITMQVDAWAKVSSQAGAKYIAVGSGREGVGTQTDHDRLKEALEAEPDGGLAELWLVLIGHGTFDGREAKLNLRGPDVSATELSNWLKRFQRPLAVIDTTASSAPFL